MARSCSRSFTVSAGSVRRGSAMQRPLRQIGEAHGAPGVFIAGQRVAWLDINALAVEQPDVPRPGEPFILLLRQIAHAPCPARARTSPMPPGASVSISARSEEHTSELQSLMRISYAVFCLKKKKTHNNNTLR